jgi:hypothetical protein
MVELRLDADFDIQPNETGEWEVSLWLRNIEGELTVAGSVLLSDVLEEMYSMNQTDAGVLKFERAGELESLKRIYARLGDVLARSEDA